MTDRVKIISYGEWFRSLSDEKQKSIRDNGLWLTVGQAFARGVMVGEVLGKREVIRIVENSLKDSI